MGIKLKKFNKIQKIFHSHIFASIGRGRTGGKEPNFKQKRTEITESGYKKTSVASVPFCSKTTPCLFSTDCNNLCASALKVQDKILQIGNNPYFEAKAGLAFRTPRRWRVCQAPREYR
jgi:hypothetical protein